MSVAFVVAVVGDATLLNCADADDDDAAVTTLLGGRDRGEINAVDILPL